MKYLGQKTVVPLKANILSLFPMHRRYFELFGGTGEILNSKAQATFSAIVEISDSLVQGDMNVYSACAVVTLDYWRRNWQTITATQPGTVVVHGCAISFLDWLIEAAAADDLIYADPPYLLSERSSKNSKYQHELTDEQHTEFLNKMKRVCCRAVISHYDCSQYDEALMSAGWFKIVVNVSYRGTVRKEALYYNFPFNSPRHEASRAGVDKTDRQRIKRKASRWFNKYMQLPEYERQAIIEQIQRSHK